MPSRRDFLTTLAGAIPPVLAGTLPLPLLGRLAQEASPAPHTFLALGDSLTAAYGLERSEGWLRMIEDRLHAAGRPWRVVDGGVSGDTTKGGRGRIRWLLRQPVDVALVALGGNDALRGIAPGETEANLDGILATIREVRPQARLVVAGMLAPPNLGPGYAAEFGAIFPRVAAAHGAHLIPFMLEGVAGDPALNLPDGIHPNPDGQRVVAELLWSHLDPIFREVEGASAPPGDNA